MAPAETTAVGPMIDGLRQLHADVRRCWTRDGMFEALARSFTSSIVKTVTPKRGKRRKA